MINMHNDLIEDSSTFVSVIKTIHLIDYYAMFFHYQKRMIEIAISKGMHCCQ